MSFFSALYMLRYVLIVQLFIVTCILIQKKKKKQTKKDPYFGMGKNTKVMPQNVLLSILFLGKGRESLHLKPYEKLSLQVRFMTCSAAHTKLDKVSMMHLKIAQNVYFFMQILHLSSKRRERNSALIFQFMTPTPKLFVTSDQRTLKIQPRKTRISGTQNYLSLQTRESSKPNPERQEFQENALTDPCKNAHK